MEAEHKDHEQSPAQAEGTERPHHRREFSSSKSGRARRDDEMSGEAAAVGGGGATGGGEAEGITPNVTIYINNLNEKIKLEGDTLLSSPSLCFPIRQ